MARPDYATIRELPDYAVTNTWEISITPPSGINIDSDSLNAVCSNVSPRPKVSNTPLSTNIRSVKIHQPGDSVLTETIAIKILETTDKRWSEVCRQWFEMCQDVKTKHAALRKDVHAKIILTELNRQNEPVYRYILEGCFLTDIDVPEFNSDQALQEMTLTLTYDYFDESKV